MIFHHCLHGYSHGHRLLASSLRIEPDETRTEANLHIGLSVGRKSDLSGYIPVGEVVPDYETGYQVGRVYVFARTWYDPDCPRGGCVLTHSLLIPLGHAETIPDIYAIESAFRRPPPRTTEPDKDARPMGWKAGGLDFYRGQIEVHPEWLPTPHPEQALVSAFEALPQIVVRSEVARELIQFAWMKAISNQEPLPSFRTYALGPGSSPGGSPLRIQGIPNAARAAFYDQRKFFVRVR